MSTHKIHFGAEMTKLVPTIITTAGAMIGCIEAVSHTCWSSVSWSCKLCFVLFLQPCKPEDIAVICYTSGTTGNCHIQSSR